MPQLDLITGDSVMYGVTLGITSSPTDPSMALVSLQVLNRRMVPIAKWSTRMDERLALCLPWLAKGVIEAYQYAPEPRDIVEVAKHMLAVAREDVRRAERSAALARRERRAKGRS